MYALAEMKKLMMGRCPDLGWPTRRWPFAAMGHTVCHGHLGAGLTLSHVRDSW